MWKVYAGEGIKESLKVEKNILQTNRYEFLIWIQRAVI
jgi:hypothetical protein